MKNFPILAFVFILVSSCSPSRYMTADYDTLASQHTMIAVLPYDIKMIGNKAMKMDPDEIDKIIEVESQLFQESLYSEVLERTGRSKNDIKISVQSISKTNRLLSDAGIPLYNIGEYGPAQLGEILGVDAVISTRLIKEEFLSREAALAAQIITGAVVESGKLPVPIRRSKLTRTSEVDVYCTIEDTRSESAIWVYNTDMDLQWDNDPNDVIELINRKISRRFPYR